MNIYVTSDLHLNHRNIVQMERYNLDRNGLQDITTIEEYNKMIIERINKIVHPEDILYILGDVCFGKPDVVAPLLHRINGHKFLILGNHDHYTPDDAEKLGLEKIHNHPIYLPEGKGKIILSHYPLQEAFNNPFILFNLHGHLHTSDLVLPNFFNVNIAMNNYQPLPMSKFLHKIDIKGLSRRQKWLTEWYAEYQRFPVARANLVLKPNGMLDVEATKKLKEEKEKQKTEE